MLAFFESLSAVAPILSDDLLEEALYHTIDQLISHTASKPPWDYLTNLMPYLPERLCAVVIYEAKRILAWIDCEERRTENHGRRSDCGELQGDALAMLFRFLPVHEQVAILPQALNAARACSDRIGVEVYRVYGLAGVLPHLHGEERAAVAREALQASQSAYTASDWLFCLTEVVNFLCEPERTTVLTEALTYVLRELQTASYSRLGELVPYLSESQYAEALRAVKTASSNSAREEALEQLAPHLTKPLLIEAMTFARTINDGPSRACALAALARYLSEAECKSVMADALEAVRSTDAGQANPKIAASLMPHLPEPERSVIAAEVLHSGALEKHDDALAALFPHLPSSMLAEALAAVETLPSGTARARALQAAAPRLTGVLASQALRLAEKRHVRDSVTLAAVASCVTGAERRRALNLALRAMERTDNKEERATTLRILLPLVEDVDKERLLLQAVEAARAAKSPKVLAAIIQHLPISERPSVIAEVLEAAQDYSGVYKAEVLLAIAPYTPEPQRVTLCAEELTECLRGISAEAAATFSSTIPSEIAVQVLDEVIAGADASSRDSIFNALASFASTLAHLEGAEGVRTVVRAVREIATWFP
jgi:hypothetical protein